MADKLRLTDKSIWTIQNAVSIAQMLGYVADLEFSAALDAYKKSHVEHATIVDFLGVLAIPFFKKWKPPLTPAPKK